MNEKSILDYLLTQGPTILFMGLVNYFQYKYFTQTIKEKDAYIKEALGSKDILLASKDADIKSMHREQVEMTRQATEVMNGLKGLLEEMRADINKTK